MNEQQQKGKKMINNIIKNDHELWNTSCKRLRHFNDLPNDEATINEYVKFWVLKLWFGNEIGPKQYLDAVASHNTVNCIKGGFENNEWNIATIAGSDCDI